MLRIEIPMLPPRELNPNWHGHWTKKRKATQAFREAAMFSALAAYKIVGPSYLKAEVSITLVIPDKRYCRDTDNLLASLKPAIDGCVDAGVIIGDSDKYLRYKLPVIYDLTKQKELMTILEFKRLK